jgi:hypothetical protein
MDWRSRRHQVGPSENQLVTTGGRTSALALFENGCRLLLFSLDGVSMRFVCAGKLRLGGGATKLLYGALYLLRSKIPATAGGNLVCVFGNPGSGSLSGRKLVFA